MIYLIISLIGIFIVGFIILFWRLKELTKTVDSKLGETHKAVQNQFQTIQSQSGQSLKIVQEVTEKLTQLSETNKQIVGFAEQLQSLENVLTSPKQRGILGEYFLESVLKNVLPPKTYQMQYKFKDGTIVDAVVFVKDKIIPVDSKFSLENYNRIVREKNIQEKKKLEKDFKKDLKKRIDETSKYIKPSEGTMDFAFMFIPSEAIFYDLLVSQVGAIKISARDLIEYAFREKHVIIVSPTTFLAYLQTVLQGLRALQFEKTTKEIQQKIETLRKHLLSYNNYMQKLGNNLGTTVSMYNQAYGEFKKINKDVHRIVGGENKIEPLKIEKPEE